MTLIKKVKELSLEPSNEDKYSCEFFEWFLENVYFEDQYSKYPTLWFIKQEPTYQYWETNCNFLTSEIYKNLISYDTRFMLFKDMKKWLISTIKYNFIGGLDPC